MAWDTEATRRRLKEAATPSSRSGVRTARPWPASTSGPGSTRSACTGTSATAGPVRDGALRRAREARIGTVPTRPADIGEYAGRLFDYHASPPRAGSPACNGRASWADPRPDEVNRTAHYRQKVEAFAAAQRNGTLDDELDPAHLTFMLTALAAWWLSVPQLARMLTGAEANDPAEHARRRAFVVGPHSDSLCHSASAGRRSTRGRSVSDTGGPG